MTAKEFAARMYAGLDSAMWGDIDPLLFKYIAEDTGAGDLSDEMIEWKESLEKIIEEALANKPVAIPIMVANAALPIETGKITAEDIKKELKDALQRFGTYSFCDKGVDEVMDGDRIAERLKTEHSAEAIIAILKEVDTFKLSAKDDYTYGKDLVEYIIHSFDGDDDLFEELEVIDSEFLGDHY